MLFKKNTSQNSSSPQTQEGNSFSYDKNFYALDVLDYRDILERSKQGLLNQKQNMSKQNPIVKNYPQKVNSVRFVDRGMEFESPEMIIGEGVFIKGEIVFNRLIQIDGSFEGEFKTSQGKIIVGPLGNVKSNNMKFESAWIEGRVEGNIETCEKLIVMESAVIIGEIVAKSISVCEGAKIQGNVFITTNKVDDNVNLDRESKT